MVNTGTRRVYWAALVLAGCGAGSDNLGVDTEGSTGSTDTSGPGIASGDEGLDAADGSDDPNNDGDGGGGDCMAHQLACSGACVVPDTDPANCGSCGRTCEAAELCSGGDCVAAPEDCTAAGASCPGGHYCDLGSGQCLLGCAFADQCPQPGECELSSHTCRCTQGTLSCDGVCVAQGVSACGEACETCDAAPAHAQPMCSSGSCDFACDPGFHRCDAACVASDSLDHCGSACSPCPAVANATSTCDGTSCGFACDPGFHESDGSCTADCTPASCGAEEVCDPDGGSCASCPATASETEPNDTLGQADVIPGTPPFFGAMGGSCLEGEVDVWTLDATAPGFWAFVTGDAGEWDVEIRQGATLIASEQCSGLSCDPGGTLIDISFVQPVEFYVTHTSGALPAEYFVEYTQ